MFETAVTPLKNQSGVRIKLHVRPGAKRNRISGLFGDSLKLELLSPPVDGKANSALIKFFAGLFGVSRGAVMLVSGECCRDKVIEIINCDPENIIKILSEQK